MYDFTSHYVTAGGIKTHYLQMGDATAPVVVLIHGGGAGADAYGNWRTVAPLLANKYCIIAVEMVGFGKTEKPDPASYVYSQKNRVEHLAAFIHKLGIAPARLVGNSMGGATALGVAMEYPELVSKLVLMGSAGLNSEITEALKPIIFYDFSKDGMRRLISALTGSNFTVTDELVEFRHKLSIEPETRKAYENIMSWIRQSGGLYYEEASIAMVKTPTLIVNGKDDIVVPITHGYRFLELLENSWGYFIPHCGHWAMIEAAPDFASATTRFLEGYGA